MGCDGGTIPRRDELVKVKKKPETKDKDAELAFKWRCCSITQQMLQTPIVTCGLGRFYNKLALIEALLNRDTLPECARHIKSLKDVKNLNLTENPAYNGDGKNAPYVCPVIGLEMSGRFRFVGLWSCGCVFSERALKEIQTNNCHKCQKAFVDDDVVILNPSDEDVPLMTERMHGRAQSKKKSSNKEKNVKVKEELPTTSLPSSSNTTKIATTTAHSINTKKEPTITKKRPIVSGSLGGNVDQHRSAKKIKADYSVAKDPNASDVYKSLFTSHKSEKEQGRAHWITYNPFYN